MIHSYIYYKGGQYGDLVFSIVNNGVHVPQWIQTKLKNNDSYNDLNFKNFIDKLPLKVITGCASYPLEWNFENYELVCTDKNISAFTVTRLIELNPYTNLKKVLQQYYSNELDNYINNLSEDQAYKILVKKYQESVPCIKVKKSNLISIDEIYNKEKFILNLSSFFEFDLEIAHLQYDQWYERELLLLNKFFKPV